MVKASEHTELCHLHTFSFTDGRGPRFRTLFAAFNHLFLRSFCRYGAKVKPMYINVVRDPIERLVSYYYFLRFGDDYRPGLRRRKQGDKKVLKLLRHFAQHFCVSKVIVHHMNVAFQTFDECVSSGGSDCAPEKLWLQIPFFCGHHSECWWVALLYVSESGKCCGRILTSLGYSGFGVIMELTRYFHTWEKGWLHLSRF